MWPFGKKDAAATTHHHYAFAHSVLRQVVMDDPVGALGAMGGDERDAFMNHLWQCVCDHCNHEGPAPFSLSDISLMMANIGQMPVLVVEMPTPREVAEAYFVAVVLKINPHELMIQPNQRPEARYFTLEKGVRPDGSPCTVLGAWDAKGAHLNYGEGPRPDVQEFLAAVAQRLD